MKHKIKVVILPTKDKGTSPLIIQKCIKKLSDVSIDELKLSPRMMHSEEYFQEQNIYITVSQDVEPINDGDYYLCKDNKLRKCKTSYEIGGRKIIATTDPNLVIECKKGTCTRGCSGHYHKCMESKPIPQVKQSFLKEFVANPDGEWEVEYEWEEGEKFELDNLDTARFINDTELENCSGTVFNKSELSKAELDYVKYDKDALARLELKLNQDNTVNITSVEEEMIILTRAQLKNILHCVTGNVKDFVMHEDRFINDWIKENL